jgi:glyoxylase-like metal-dependent hydrolase (beta-lactamase superfamily II)
VIGRNQTNCYFLYREGSPEAIVIDPADQGDKIADKLAGNGFKVCAIYLTHGHFDHIWGVDGLKQSLDTPVKVYACEAERELLQDPYQNISGQMHRPCTVEADVYVRDGEEITTADISCKVIATPGHTIGGCCYYFAEAGILVCGDTLFQESVGRTDFPTGDMSALVRSVREKLFVLPEETKCFPGHGDSTTIGHEKKYNPFCV